MPKLSGNVENFTFEVSGLSDELKVFEFRGEESVSQIFHYHLTLVCENAALNFEQVVGKPAVLTFYDNEQKEERYVNGIVGRFIQSDDGNKLTTYNALLVPQIWNMQFHHDCRIFQHKKIADIIKDVLDGAGIAAESYKFSLQGNYLKRDYCVQYRESDLNFIQRLMEQEGMFYYFEHKKDGHVLVIADHLSTHKSISGANKILYNPPSGTVVSDESIFPFIYSEEVRPGGVAITDYNFTKPSLNLMSNKQYSKNQKLEVYDYPGEYEIPEEGARYANVQMESWQVARKKGHGESDVMRLVAGFKFTMEAHPRSEFNNEYMLTRLVFHARQPQVLGERGGGAGDFKAEFYCIPADVQFRPLATTPKPIVEGIQTAIVVGPSNEEIYTDEHGRVKVQFHWDREGKKDENSSCWIRVSQSWAGAGWGAIAIPRINQEVIVDFVEGDPDRPVITGRVYHGTNLSPYPLPTYKTRMSIKSKTHKGTGYNELRFEDEKGIEQVFMHGQKDMDIIIENDRREHIKHDRHLRVDNDRTEEISNDSSSKVGRDRTEATGRKLSQTIGEEHAVQVGDNYHLKTGKAQFFQSGKQIVIESGEELTVRSSGGFIKIDASGITLQGKVVNINSGGSPGVGMPVQANIAKSAVLATSGAVSDISPPSSGNQNEPKASAAADGLPSFTPNQPPSALSDSVQQASQQGLPSIALS